MSHPTDPLQREYRAERARAERIIRLYGWMEREYAARDGLDAREVLDELREALWPAEPEPEPVPVDAPRNPAAVRGPEPGERCSCGRAAIVIYRTERFGDVPDCGVHS